VNAPWPGFSTFKFGLSNFEVLSPSQVLLSNLEEAFGSLMPSPEESNDPACHAEASRRRLSSPFNDVQENVRQFNEDEAVWRCFVKKRARRKLLRSLKSQPPLTDEELDRIDWHAAEREARPIRAIGRWIVP
jgi:hypothetical protein